MDADEQTGRAFAVVHDIAASWERYWPWRAALEAAAGGELIFHAAGRTDEGFRTIDVWCSQAAWRRSHAACVSALGPLPVVPLVRVLDVRALMPGRADQPSPGGHS